MRKLQLSGLFGNLIGDHVDHNDPNAPAMSPDPETGGGVPLPSFGPDGEYIPPTGVPFNPRMPRNTLVPEKPIDKKELAELIRKIKGVQIELGPQPPKKLSF